MRTRVAKQGANVKSRTVPVPIRFSSDETPVLRLVTARARANSRSVSGQLKHYAKLGLIAEDNPDLPMSLVIGILEARAELAAGFGQPYQWGVLDGGRSTRPVHHGSEAGPPVAQADIQDPDEGFFVNRGQLPQHS